MTSALSCFVNDEDGQDLVEYAMLFLFVSMASFSAVVVFGGLVITLWDQVAAGIVALADLF